MRMEDGVFTHPGKQPLCDSASISGHQESIQDLLFDLTSTGSGGEIKFQLKATQYLWWKTKLKNHWKDRWRSDKGGSAVMNCLHFTSDICWENFSGRMRHRDTLFPSAPLWNYDLMSVVYTRPSIKRQYAAQSTAKADNIVLNYNEGGHLNSAWKRQ